VGCVYSLKPNATVLRLRTMMIYFREIWRPRLRTPRPAVVVASEPVSHEDWREVRENSVYRVSEHFLFESEPL